MFSKDRKAFEELCESYREQIEVLKAKPAYVTIPVPESKEDQQSYVNSVAQLDQNRFLLYHLVDMWEKASQAFVQGQGSPEFHRGYMKAVNDLIMDGRKCAAKKVNNVKA